MHKLQDGVVKEVDVLSGHSTERGLRCKLLGGELVSFELFFSRGGGERSSSCWGDER